MEENEDEIEGLWVVLQTTSKCNVHTIITVKQWT